MKTHQLTQGTPEWHVHRAQHFNASDAPAMLGCSPYKSRTQLLHEAHTGLHAEPDAATQRLFDDGHRFEALARALAEQIIGDDLAPVVGSEGTLSASFDGLTLMGDTAFEHKTLNADLRGCMGPSCLGRDLPKHYQAQMEQQLLVSGAERVLFMASKWDGTTLLEERHCWYASDPTLRAEIVAGWAQFEQDLAAYTPPAAAVVIVAAPVQALPAVSVQVAGAITVKDNFAAFEVALRDFLEHRLIREPKTDQDFANLDVQIKAMKGAEAALDSAETQMLAQIQTVDSAKKTKDMLSRLVRDNRLMAEKLLASEKERRRGEIVAGGIAALREHLATLNTRLGKPYMPQVPADFAGAIKGKKSLASMEDAVATELARAKIAASESADRIQTNLQTLRELAADHAFLFADTPALVQKAPDDCRAIIASRIADHAAAEQRRLDAERERIRAEEAARADREAQERATAERRQREEEAAREQQRQALAARATRANEAGAAAMEAISEARRADDLPTPLIDALEQAASGIITDLAIGRAAEAAKPPAANVVPIPARTLRLGQINERIAPLQIDASGLARLGFQPVAVEKAAKLYALADLPRILAACIAHLQAVATHQHAA